MLIRAVLLVAVLLFGAAPLFAQQPAVVAPSQKDVIRNSNTTSAANAAAVATITGIANQRARLYSFKARCSAGTSTVTITENAVTTWSTVAGAITTADGGAIWMPPKTAATGVTMVITLATCGGGNTGTLTVQADQY